MTEREDFIMFIKIENREQGRHFTFFSKEREINGEKVKHTEKSVFATLSEGIKVGEKNGQPLWENDYWNTVFCGKAYEKALTLKDRDRISVVEMNIRNIYVERVKKTFPQIMVTDFDIISTGNNSTDNDGFMNVPEEVVHELPFNN